MTLPISTTPGVTRLMTSERDAAPGGSADNYYDLLGLAPGASDEEIEAAYADLSSMFAAGKVPASRQEYARKQRARLAAAYSVLADPDQRGAYDRRLGVGSRPPVTPALPAELRAEAQQITIAPGAVTGVDAADLPPPVPIPEAPAALPV